MPSLFDDISLHDLQVTFDADLMETATQIHLEGRVEDMELEQDGTLRGTVLDRRRRYHVSISPQKNMLQMTCDCGGMRGRPCAHALALLVEWVVDHHPEGREFESEHSPESAGPPVRVVQASFFPPADASAIRKDWSERLKSLTVKEMRDLAAARRLKLKGTLREHVWEGLLQGLVEPGALPAALEGLAPDTHRLLNVLSVLAGAAPRFSSTQIMPYLDAALNNGLKSRPASACLRELFDAGLFQSPETARGYPVPLQVLAQCLPNPDLFMPFSGEPERVEMAQPFQFTRLALRLLLMAQGGQLRCAPQDKHAARGSWPQPVEERNTDEMEILPEAAYLESSLRASLAAALALPEAAIDLAARLLEGGGMWARRTPQRLSERAPDWLRLSPQEQSRRLFALAAGYPTQVELDLARQAGFIPWRSSQRAPGYQEFLAEMGWARLRLARLVAHLPAGRWFEVDSVLRTVHGLQPGWLMEYHTRHDNPGSRNARDTLATGASIGRTRVDPFRYPDWLKAYGRLHLAFLTHTLRWLGLVDVGWQGGHPAAVRLSTFGEFLAGRQPVFELPAPPAAAPPLVMRADWSLELDLDTAPLDLVNLLLKIAAPAPEAVKGKPSPKKLAYRIYEGGLGQAFADGWTLEQIVSSLEAGLRAPLPAGLLGRMQPLWERFGRLQIYDDMTLIEFGDDFCLPELLAATSLSQILLTTFTPRLVAVRTDKAAEYLAELQAKGYTPRAQGGSRGG